MSILLEVLKWADRKGLIVEVRGESGEHAIPVVLVTNRELGKMHSGLAGGGEGFPPDQADDQVGLQILKQAEMVGVKLSLGVVRDAILDEPQPGDMFNRYRPGQKTITLD
jgi:hypothetical protein